MAVTDSEWRPVPGASRYEASAGRPGEPGQVRNLAGRILATGRSNRGYVTVTLTFDDGRRAPCGLHVAILSAWRGPRPPGQQGCHLDDNLDHNWLANLVWGTQSDNERHKAANGNAAPPQPSYPCLNAPECDRLSLHSGRRCTDCVRQAGIDIAARLGRQENLVSLAEEYGFGVEWAWRLARQGGYEGQKGEALRQRPPLSRRVMARLSGRTSQKVTASGAAGGHGA